MGVGVEEGEVPVSTAPQTEGVAVGVGCSVEVEVRESACSVGVEGAETVVRAAPFG